MKSNHPIDVLKRKIGQASPNDLSKIHVVLAWIVDSNSDALIASIRLLNLDKDELIEKLSKDLTK